jgi:hypothetical protein
MSGAIPPPPNAFMAWCLVKVQEQFTFTLSRSRITPTSYSGNILHTSVGEVAAAARRTV